METLNEIKNEALEIIESNIDVLTNDEYFKEHHKEEVERIKEETISNIKFCYRIGLIDIRKRNNYLNMIF